MRVSWHGLQCVTVVKHVHHELLHIRAFIKPLSFGNNIFKFVLKT